jgi:hypothetical protein
MIRARNAHIDTDGPFLPIKACHHHRPQYPWAPLVACRNPVQDVKGIAGSSERYVGVAWRAAREMCM